MKIRLSIWGMAQLFAFGGAVVLVLAWGAFRAVKHAIYYQKVDAVVQTAGMGCSVRGLTESSRAVLAKIPRVANEQWFDCDEPVRTIAEFGKDVKVSWRPQAHVRFVSPADGRERVTLVALTVDQSRGMPASGATLPVYAHKQDPSIVDPDY
jgi:hypothetical protein